MILPLIVIVIVIAAALWMLARRVGRKDSSGGGHDAARRTPLVVRMAESLVLLLIALTILVIAAWQRSSGGLLGMLNELQPQFAAASVIAFAIAACGVLAAAFLAWWRRTGIATFLTAVVLILYGLWINSGSTPGMGFMPESWLRPKTDYTITCGLPGAEVWVNGVNLGKTPLTMRLDEFVQKVPVWKEPPAGLAKDVHLPEYAPTSHWTSDDSRWAKFELPQVPEWGPGLGTRPSDESKRQAYYAQFRYAGEWGVMTGSSGGGGGGSRLTYSAHTSIGVMFPQRDARLEMLLKQARARDYRVTPEWFAAIESFDEDGYNTLKKEAAVEPGFRDVLRDWARWKYGLEKVHTSEEALAAFERICDEADATREYLPTSVAGEAVAILTKQIPTERLVERAKALLGNAHSRDWGFMRWNLGDDVYYGYTERVGGVNLPGGDGSYSFSGSGQTRMPPRTFAVAQALRAKWEAGESRELIRDRIAPALVANYFDAGLSLPLELAAEMGGPAVDKFLLRQNWRATGDAVRWEDRLGIGMADVNRWLYLLTRLQDEAGVEFRRQHEADVLSLCEQVVRAHHGFGWDSKLDFMVADRHLAEAFWPRFAAYVREKGRDESLKLQWEYLRRMGAPAARFVEAWEQTRLADSYHWGFAVLNKVDEPRRSEVIRGLLESIERNPGALAKTRLDDPVREVTRLLKGKLHPVSNTDMALEALRSGSVESQEKVLEAFTGWIQTKGKREVDAEKLAAAPETQIRLLAVAAARSWPVQSRRDLLDKLIRDPDEAIRQQATAAVKELEQLSGADPSQWRSDGVPKI